MEMTSVPVYKFYLVKPSIEVSQAPQEQVAEALQQRDEAMQRTGVRVLLQANMVWSNERYKNFGFEVFPNLEALIEYHDCLNQIHWFDYADSTTYLGVTINAEGQLDPYTAPPPPEPGTQPIYKAYLMRPTARYYEDRPGVEKIMAGFQDVHQRAGIVPILSAYTRWNNEKWLTFGLERYPSFNAFYEKNMMMESLGWYSYTQSQSFLGRAMEGELAG